MPTPQGVALATDLRVHGFGVTFQHLLILSAVRDTGGRITASDVAGAGPELYANGDVSAVYRSPMAASDGGPVIRSDLPDRDIEFELKRTAHHHLVCEHCGGVDALSSDALIQLGSSLMQEKGFAADLRHIAVRGTCTGCRVPMNQPGDVQ